MSDDPLPGLPRDLTKDDWIIVTVRTPNGEEQTTGGRFDGMSISGKGGICIDYLVDPDEGWALSAYLPWITKIQLSDEEFLSRDWFPDQPPVP